MTYISLVNIYDQSSDIKTKKTNQSHAVVETLDDTPENCAKLHKKRLEMAAKGLNMQVIRTAKKFEDPANENPRRQRRAFAKLLRKLMKKERRRLPTPDQQKQVDAEVDKIFEKKKGSPKRRKSGLIVPGRRGQHR